MARIEGISEKKAGLFARIAYRMARKRLGRVPEPMTILAHHPIVFRGYGLFEMSIQKARQVKHRLKALAEIKTALLVGCPF